MGICTVYWLRVSRKFRPFQVVVLYSADSKQIVVSYIDRTILNGSCYRRHMKFGIAVDRCKIVRARESHNLRGLPRKTDILAEFAEII